MKSTKKNINRRRTLRRTHRRGGGPKTTEQEYRSKNGHGDWYNKRIQVLPHVGNKWDPSNIFRTKKKIAENLAKAEKKVDEWNRYVDEEEEFYKNNRKDHWSAHPFMRTDKWWKEYGPEDQNVHRLFGNLKEDE